MDLIGLDRPSGMMQRFDFGEVRLSDCAVPDLWALWWKVGRALVVSLMGMLGLWLVRSRQRDDLQELDAHLLRDIGVTDEQARKETRKPFWQE